MSLLHDHNQGAIRVDNLSYRYPDSEPLALDAVSFEVNPGDTVAIMGRVVLAKTLLASDRASYRSGRRTNLRYCCG